MLLFLYPIYSIFLPYSNSSPMSTSQEMILKVKVRTKEDTLNRVVLIPYLHETTIIPPVINTNVETREEEVTRDIILQDRKEGRVTIEDTNLLLTEIGQRETGLIVKEIEVEVATEIEGTCFYYSFMFVSIIPIDRSNNTGFSSSRPQYQQ